MLCLFCCQCSPPSNSVPKTQLPATKGYGRPNLRLAGPAADEVGRVRWCSRSSITGGLELVQSQSRTSGRLCSSQVGVVVSAPVAPSASPLQQHAERGRHHQLLSSSQRASPTVSGHHILSACQRLVCAVAPLPCPCPTPLVVGASRQSDRLGLRQLVDRPATGAGNVHLWMHTR